VPFLHRVFGHPAPARLKATIAGSSPLVAGVSKQWNCPASCRCCALGKSTALPRDTTPARRAQADVRLGEVSSDFHGPYDIPGVHGERYCMVLIDGFSRLHYTIPLQSNTAAAALGGLRDFIRDVGKPKNVPGMWGLNKPR
jgi:hypothetical protein